MAEYTFDKVHHGDLVLAIHQETSQEDTQQYNLGYNNILDQPILAHVAYRQQTDRSIFRGYPQLDDERIRFEDRLDPIEDSVEWAKKYGERLPTEESSWNNEPWIYRLGGFNDGSNRNFSYKWNMNNGNMELLVEKMRGVEAGSVEQVLSLSAEEYRRYALAHANFCTQEESFGAVMLQYRKIINILANH